jgi:hypothetical protein
VLAQRLRGEPELIKLNRCSVGIELPCRAVEHRAANLSRAPARRERGVDEPARSFLALQDSIFDLKRRRPVEALITDTPSSRIADRLGCENSPSGSFQNTMRTPSWNRALQGTDERRHARYSSGPPVINFAFGEELAELSHS